MGSERFFRLFDELRRSAPGALAVSIAESGRTVSRQDLSRLAERLLPSVDTASSAEGVVAVQAPNSPELIAAILAVFRLGRIPLLIDRERTADEVESLARALGLPLILTGTRLERRVIDGVDSTLVPPSGTALLKLTSGSTGEPRAVAVGHEAHAAGVAQICSTMGIGADDRNLVTLPLAHSYGFDNVIGTLFQVGTGAVLLSDLVPRRLFSVLRTSGVTVWPAVPLLLDVLTRARTSEASLGALRLVLSAGAPLSASTREAFFGRFGLWPRTFYGATECGGIAYDREGTADVPDGCVGRPLDGVSVELVDPEDGIGRLAVRSPSLAAATLPNSEMRAAGDPWLVSDLCRIDPQGRIHLIGRVGEFVKIHGYKVYPHEVERVIREVTGVHDVVVLPYERSTASEGLRAVVAAEGGVTRCVIARACERALPAYKVPRSIEIRSELPRNERGKLDRSRL